MREHTDNTFIATEVIPVTEPSADDIPRVQITKEMITATYKSETMTLTRDKGKMWMTYKELAEHWGYKNERSVANIIARHRDEFRSLITVVTQQNIDKYGVTRNKEIRMINRVGMYLFGSLCQTEKGKKFRLISAMMWDAIDSAIEQHYEKMNKHRKFMQKYYQNQYERLLRADRRVQFLMSLEEHSHRLPPVKAVSFFKSGPRVTYCRN